LRHIQGVGWGLSVRRGRQPTGAEQQKHEGKTVGE
jgi:hypothetical protein